MLDIKVETINTVVLEWTRENAIEVRVIRSEGVPQEVRKPDGNCIVQDGYVRRVTADGEHDGLSHLLADWDILPDLMAAHEKLRARVEGTITLVAKVGTRPSSDDIWEDIDETDVDDVQRGLLAEVAQTRLVGTLTLQTISMKERCCENREAYVVDSDISFRIDVQGDRGWNQRSQSRNGSEDLGEGHLDGEMKGSVQIVEQLMIKEWQAVFQEE